MKINWKLPDIIDLEYFLLKDGRIASEAGEEVLKERDRSLFLDEIDQVVSESPAPDRSVLIRMWLETMRRNEEGRSDSPLPGRLWNEVYHLFSWGLTGAGVLAGAAIAFSLLSYSGETPVNVFLFLAVLIFPQIGLLTAALVLYAGRRWLKMDITSSPLISLLSRLFSATARRVSRALGNRMDERTRLSLQTISGVFTAKQKIYGTIFFWPLFILLQLFGVGFNAGALTATLLKVTGSDVAFGWQSTLQVSAETIAAIVKVMAAPWSWFMPAGTACPNVAQIEGSRLVLKEGIYHLSSSDLVSWWPFLCMCLLFYGLIPRLALFAWGRFMLGRALSGLRFHAASFRDIERRMMQPSVISAGEPLQPEGRGYKEEGAESRAETASAAEFSGVSQGRHAGSGAGMAHGKQTLILVPDELLEYVPEETISSACRHLGLHPSRVLTIEEPCDLRLDPCGQEIRAHLDAHERPDTIVLVQEAWQPPIQETLSFVRDIRAMAGPDCLIVVALVGQPAPDGSIMPVKEQDFTIWQQKITTLKDPAMQVTELLKS